MMTITLSKRLAPITVVSYKEASDLVRADIDRRGIGSSAWYRSLPRTATSKGAAIHIDGVQVAFVSYNGRVWKGVDDGKLGHEEIKI